MQPAAIDVAALVCVMARSNLCDGVHIGAEFVERCGDAVGERLRVPAEQAGPAHTQTTNTHTQNTHTQIVVTSGELGSRPWAMNFV